LVIFVDADAVIAGLVGVRCEAADVAGAGWIGPRRCALEMVAEKMRRKKSAAGRRMKVASRFRLGAFTGWDGWEGAQVSPLCKWLEMLVVRTSGMKDGETAVWFGKDRIHETSGSGTRGV
jgi:hypothetical protein